MICCAVPECHLQYMQHFEQDLKKIARLFTFLWGKLGLLFDSIFFASQNAADNAKQNSGRWGWGVVRMKGMLGFSEYSVRLIAVLWLVTGVLLLSVLTENSFTWTISSELFPAAAWSEYWCVNSYVAALFNKSEKLTLILISEISYILIR